MNAAATTAPAMHEQPSARNASRVPPELASHGSPAAAAAPPIGIAVWRTPSARPRSSQREPAHDRAAARRVHARTERAGGEEQRRRAGRYVCVRPATIRARPAIVRPSAITTRSLQPVGEEPPRQEREEHADADRAEHDAGLAEREPVVRRAARARAPAARRRARRSSPARACPRRGSPTGSACPNLLRLPHLGRVRALVLRAFGLDHGGQSLQPRVAEEDAELLAEQALADVRMPVAVRTERRRGVVDVQRAQAVEPDRRRRPRRAARRARRYR